MSIEDTKLSKRRLKKRIRRLNSKKLYKSGLEAKFFNINGVGIKLYDEKQDAEYAHENQSLAADNSLGPQVFEKINVKGIGFGFITEIADTSIGDYWDINSEESKTLEAELADIGIYHYDLHDGNVGRINGETVCIDFGPVSS